MFSFFISYPNVANIKLVNIIKINMSKLMLLDKTEFNVFNIIKCGNIIVKKASIANPKPFKILFFIAEDIILSNVS